MRNKKNSNLGPFWAFFADFRANKNFSAKSASVTFLFLHFYCCAELQKKLINKFQQKLVTNK